MLRHMTLILHKPCCTFQRSGKNQSSLSAKKVWRSKSELLQFVCNTQLVIPLTNNKLLCSRYLQKLETERKEFSSVWNKAQIKIRAESPEPPVLDSSMLAADQLAFLKNSPDLKEFIDTVMTTTSQVAEYVKRKNRLLKRQDLVIEKFNYVLNNKIADIITEAELSS
jgi:hypothetical protein